jgi:hypothetical protein
MASRGNIPGLVAVSLALVGGYVLGDGRTSGPSASPARIVSASQSCDIKGNVSIGTGERIYHVPGQKYYDDTIIRPEFGERWFCSENEARAAGWRRSKV